MESLRFALKERRGMQSAVAIGEGQWPTSALWCDREEAGEHSAVFIGIGVFTNSPPDWKERVFHADVRRGRPAWEEHSNNTLKSELHAKSARRSVGSLDVRVGYCRREPSHPWPWKCLPSTGF